MLDAIDVARRLIQFGYDPTCPAESVLISPLRMQKLLYYCQGWSLALLGRPLFRQPLEAWVRGPVVVDVYERFKGTRDGLTPERAGEPCGELSATDAALIEMVWREYACYTPSQLVNMTHAEPAWREARGGIAANAYSSATLSQETMASHFRDVAQKRSERASRLGFPSIDPTAVWQAEEEADRAGGNGISAADLFGKLLAEAGE